VTEDLSTWLLEQITEDEADRTNFCHCGNIDSPDDFCLMKPGCPKRIKLECEAKRRAIAIHAATPFTNRDLGIVDATVCHICCGALDEPEDWDDRDGDWPYPLVQQPFPCQTLRLMTLPFVGRPGLRDEWRP
jgi:hypothetical protein